MESPLEKSGFYGGVSFNVSYADGGTVSGDGLDGETKFDSSKKIYGVHFGYTTGENLRADFEISRGSISGSFQDSEFLDRKGEVDISNTYFLANLYYDFYNDTFLTPYVGIALGVANTSVENTVPDIESNEKGVNFVYGVKAGVNYTLSDELIIGIEYEYLKEATSDMPNIQLDGNMHNISFGLSYFF